MSTYTEKEIHEPEITGIDLTFGSGGPSTRPFVGRRNVPVVTSTPDPSLSLFDKIGVGINQFKQDVSTFFDPTSGIDRSPDTPSQAEFKAMSEPEKRAWEAANTQRMIAESRAAGGSVGGAGGSSAGAGTAVGSTGAMSAVDALSAARQPRTTTFENIFGSVGWDPETGQFVTQEDPQFAALQTGLMGALSGAMTDYATFDTEAAAQRYIDAATAGQAETRALEDQTALSRLIASGRLGASTTARALAEQERQRGIQDVQTQLAAQQFADQQRQQQLQSLGGLFGLAGTTAQQQFAQQQAALEAIPLGQEIMSFPEEPKFQHGLFQEQLAAQQAANQAQAQSSLWSALLGAVLG